MSDEEKIHKKEGSEHRAQSTEHMSYNIFFGDEFLKTYIYLPVDQFLVYLLFVKERQWRSGDAVTWTTYL